MYLIDVYAYANHWRARHPAEKAAFALGLLLLSLGMPPAGALLILGLVVVTALAGARVPARIFLRVLAPPATFIALGSLTLLIGVAPAAGGWHPVWEQDQLARAVRLLLRGLAAAACLCFFALTTPAADWLPMLQRLGVPAVVRDLILLVYRLLFIFEERLTTMQRAHAARLGYASARNMVRSSGLIAASLFVRALERARRMEMGLASRCGAGAIPLLPGAQRPSWLVLGLIVGLWLLVGLGGFLSRSWFHE